MSFPISMKLTDELIDWFFKTFRVEYFSTRRSIYKRIIGVPSRITINNSILYTSSFTNRKPRLNLFNISNVRVVYTLFIFWGRGISYTRYTIVSTNLFFDWIGLFKREKLSCIGIISMMKTKPRNRIFKQNSHCENKRIK